MRQQQQAAEANAANDAVQKQMQAESNAIAAAAVDATIKQTQPTNAIAVSK
jgi:hypothetical protein